jgi:DNA adenine methylase
MRWPGKKTPLLARIDRFFRRNPCETLLEICGGSCVVGLTLLARNRVKRLVLVEKDTDVARLLLAMLSDSTLADRYESFVVTHENVDALEKSENSPFAYLVRTRTCWRGKVNGGKPRRIEERYCRELVARNLRRVYSMREGIQVIHGDALEVMKTYINDPSVGIFADPPYDVLGLHLYKHYEFDHPELFRLLSLWRGPWLMSQNNSVRNRRLATSHSFAYKVVRMWTSNKKLTNELLIWRKQRRRYEHNTTVSDALCCNATEAIDQADGLDSASAP